MRHFDTTNMNRQIEMLRTKILHNKNENLNPLKYFDDIENSFFIKSFSTDMFN